MDLSQQELPLTAYFTAEHKETRPRTYSSKKRKFAGDLQSTVVPSKRGRSDAESFTQNSSKKTAAHQPKARVKTTQLPTPAASSRKHVPSTHGVPRLQGAFANARPASTGATETFVKEKFLILDGIDLTQAESDATPSRALPKLCGGDEKDITEVTVADSLATPSSSNRPKRLTRAGPSHDCELAPVYQFSTLTDTGSPTPRTGLRRAHASEPINNVGVQAPFTGPSRHRYQPSRLSRVSTSSPQVVPSSVKFPVQPTDGLSRSSASSEPSHLHEEDDLFASPVERGPSIHLSTPKEPRVTFTATLLSLPSKNPDTHPPNIPANTVPSSQSQYLLHIDATPKRKRVSRRVELIPSSQTQEESELTESIPPPLIPASAAMRKLSMGESFGMNRTLNAHTQTPRPDRSGCKGQHVHTLGSTPITSPATSPSGPSRSFFATKKALDELSFFMSPLRQWKTSPYHSRGRKTRTPCEESIENVPAAPEDESVTESESEMDIFLLKAEDKSFLLEPASPGKKLSPLRSPTARKPHSPRPHKLIHEDILSVLEDGSATEAESDTDILGCVAEIGKRQARQPHAPVLTEDSPSRPVISPLVSPTRSRIAVEASFAGSTQFLMREGAGLSVPGTYTSPSRAIARRRLPAPSDSVPSVVQDFMEMFQGDGSYPEDFPESLRI
ncbi:hypothetical protein BS17DRAFT_809726 [Gyrodon lividus]|nr:hypothetical protein BS17DRAFT_809726 [Gyrodon lividus]